MNRFRLTLLAVIALATVAVSTQTARPNLETARISVSKTCNSGPMTISLITTSIFADPPVRQYKLEIRKTSNGPWEYAQNTTYNSALERIVQSGHKERLTLGRQPKTMAKG